MSAVTEKTNITISVDKSTRESFSNLCDGLGISVSSCIVALMKQAVRQQGVTLSMVDENGFTTQEANELKRRINELNEGHAEEHALIED